MHIVDPERCRGGTLRVFWDGKCLWKEAGEGAGYHCTVRDLMLMKRWVRMEAIRTEHREEFLRMAEDHFRELSPDFVPGEDWKESYFENILAHKDYFLQWILHESRRVGFILFGLEDHRFLPKKIGVVWELHVLPADRRNGIARQAAEIAIGELLKLSSSKIRLEVIEGNLAAVSFWQSLGFQKTAESYVLPLKSKTMQ